MKDDGEWIWKSSNQVTRIASCIGTHTHSTTVHLHLDFSSAWIQWETRNSKKRNIKHFMNITIASQKMKKNRRMCSQLQPSNISSDFTSSAVCLKPQVFSRRFPNCNSTENTKYGLNSLTHTSAFYASRLCYA